MTYRLIQAMNEIFICTQQYSADSGGNEIKSLRILNYPIFRLEQIPFQ